MSVTVQSKQFTLDEYHRLVEVGFFREGDRVELIFGKLYEMAAKGTRHETILRRLLRELFKIVGDRVTVSCQSPIAIPSLNSEPEPDVSLLRHREDDYLNSHPQPEDVLLVVEVADSSLEFDKTVKLPLYASAGIGVFWLVNLVDNTAEVYREPLRKPSGEWGYASCRVRLPQEELEVPGVEGVRLLLNRVFPPGA
ncbi:hypothetical protein AY599_06735 [Leptolyngbya valderiana BDU 20041]|nr:hypothetical protein AY599_06735 [Leptolyngbya valderiana BDU 20041]